MQIKANKILPQISLNQADHIYRSLVLKLANGLKMFELNYTLKRNLISFFNNSYDPEAIKIIFIDENKTERLSVVNPLSCFLHNLRERENFLPITVRIILWVTFLRKFNCYITVNNQRYIVF